MPFKVKNEAGEEVEILSAAEQAEMVTGAVKSNLDKATKKLTADLAASLAESMGKTLTEYEAKRETAAAEAEEARKAAAGNENNGTKKTPENLDDHPVVKGLKKTVQDLQAQNAQRAEAEKAKDAQLKDVKLREKLSALLSTHQIEGARAQHAIGYLVDAAKRVSWGEDGETLTFKDENGELLDAATGVKSWVSSDDGKLYAPPRGANGSGERGTGRTAPTAGSNGQGPSTSELGQALSSQLGISIS